MTPEIKPGSWWRYRGPGDGNGVRHKVVHIGGDPESPDIVTWSTLSLASGWSWLGSKSEFLECFHK